MNCKQGDLAYIVRNNMVPENLGRPVKVLRAYGDFNGHFCWVVTGSDLTAIDPKTYERMPTERGVIPDSWLRPITGLPVDEEQHDEVTA